jgi:hypothetical protein
MASSQEILSTWASFKDTESTARQLSGMISPLAMLRFLPAYASIEAF